MLGSGDEWLTVFFYQETGEGGVESLVFVGGFLCFAMEQPAFFSFVRGLQKHTRHDLCSLCLLSVPLSGRSVSFM